MRAQISTFIEKELTTDFVRYSYIPLFRVPPSCIPRCLYENAFVTARGECFGPEVPHVVSLPPKEAAPFQPVVVC